MNRFYMITNKDKDPELSVTKKIRDFLIENGRECVLGDEGPLPENCDCVLVLGGDGTLLQAARELREKDVPLLGVNLGTLGYLAELDVHMALSGLSGLLENGPEVIEERMMLKGTLFRQGRPVSSDIALNDIVVGRSSGFRIVRFNVYVDGEFLSAYAADGLIVATHGMLDRSIVFSDKSRIKLELASLPGRPETEALVGFDSDSQFPLLPGDFIEIEKAERTTKILKLSRIGFLETLRHKMSAE